MKELSIDEYRAGIKALSGSIGPRAEFYASVSMQGPAFSITLYANGIASSRSEMNFTVHAQTLRGLLKAATEKWASFADTHEKRTVRKMALAIISITAEIGHCTDAALRNCGEFDPGQVRKYGEQACAEANEIAGKGPFSIVSAGRSNAPEAA